MLLRRRDNIFTEKKNPRVFLLSPIFSPENGLKKLHAPNLYNNF